MDETDELFDEYVERGILIPREEEDGEVTYTLSEDAEFLAPELFKSYMRAIEDDVIDLVERGFVDVSFADDGEPLYSLTPLGELYAQGLLSE